MVGASAVSASGAADDSYTHYAAGALSRVMFYPSLAYNIVRSTIQPEYRWYTEILEVWPACLHAPSSASPVCSGPGHCHGHAHSRQAVYWAQG